MRRWLERVGARTLGFVRELGRLAIFAGQVARTCVRRPFRFRRLLDDLYNVGVLSIALICASAGT